MLAWAQRILADYEALDQKLGLIKAELAGRLTLGVIPTALPLTWRLSRALQARHPKVALRVLGAHAAALSRALRAPVAARRNPRRPGRRRRLPLCLLTPDMQNRRRGTLRHAPS